MPGGQVHHYPIGMLTTLALLSSLSLGQSLPITFAQEVPWEEAPPPPPVEEPEWPEPPPPPPFGTPEAQGSVPQADREVGSLKSEVSRDELEDAKEAERVEKRRTPPLLQIRALGTATAPVESARLGLGEFMIGVRGEVDVRRFGVLGVYDRVGDTPRPGGTLRETHYWNAMAGYAPWATRYHRLRLMGGVSGVTSDTTTRVGPTLGSTLRVGVPVVALEGGVFYTPAGFQQVDGRIEAVLRLLIVELRAGFRGRWVDLATEDVPVEPTGGPTVSLGLVF